MESVYTTYLSVIRQACCSSADADANIDTAITIRPEEVHALAVLSQEHRTAPFLLPFFHGTDCYASLRQQTKNMMLNYYQIEHFTHTTVSLLEKEHISCYLLKGLSLADCYPVPEYRKLGDLDLYISDKEDFDRAKCILASHGYLEEEELSDHHITYQYRFSKTGRSFLLELHYRVIGLYQYSRANEIVDEVFSANRPGHCHQTICGYSYTVLPPTEYVFYQIHHMLKHYLYSGFGIRLLCDFTLYLNRHAGEVDFDRIHTWCRESRILHLYEIILESCRIYLGLSDTIDPEIHYSHADCEQFVQQILKDGDMGTDTSSSLVGSSSYQKVNFASCLKEGHTQMKVRFPKACHYPVLWPFLWGVTFFCFLKNTYTVRNTTFLQTLRDFKKSNQKTHLIKIFENSER